MRKLFLIIPGILFIFCLNGDVLAGENSSDPNQYKIKPPEDKGYRGFPVRIMNRSTYDAYNFDPRSDNPAKISYTVSKTGWVRLRLVRRDNRDLLLRTLLDWTHSVYGPTYEVGWDGRDSSGNIVDNKKIFILFEAKDGGKTNIHEKHPEEICRDLELKIIHPKTENLRRGETKVVAVLPERPAGMGNETGYEARVYIDYNLTQTKRFNKGRREFSFMLDTTSVENGEHILTINLDDLNDHIGTASTVLKFRN